MHCDLIVNFGKVIVNEVKRASSDVYVGHSKFLYLIGLSKARVETRMGCHYSSSTIRWPPCRTSEYS